MQREAGSGQELQGDHAGARGREGPQAAARDAEAAENFGHQGVVGHRNTRKSLSRAALYNIHENVKSGFDAFLCQPCPFRRGICAAPEPGSDGMSGTATAMNLGRLLTQTARRLPGRTALVWGDRRWTWAELDARVDRLAAALRARGIGKGDRVLVHSRNSNAMFESQWACFKLGAVWVPTNFRLTPPEVAYLAATSRARAMLRDRGFAAHADAVRAAGPWCEQVLAVGDARPDETDYEAALAEAVPPPPDHEADAEYADPCWFFFTSGTTGRPKAAVLTHGQLAFVVTNHLADLFPGTTERDASWWWRRSRTARASTSWAKWRAAPAPCCCRGSGSTRKRRGGWWRSTGCRTCSPCRPSCRRWWSIRRRSGTTTPRSATSSTPARRCTGPTRRGRWSGSGRAWCSTSAGRGDGQHHRAAPRPAQLDDADPDCPLGSVGAPRTGMDVSILDAEGRRLPPGETGEICVRGPAVFAGYFENPEANAKAFAGGWFHTGDLGHLDARGFLYVTGRASDMFISGGSNVIRARWRRPC
jgi:acyl-CoA synthetase (AMP-forming)/AMP-acid ligase II